MSCLPKDAYMLVSYINTQLRDFYPSLEELCTVLGVEQDSIEQTLRTIGYFYKIEKNCFTQEDV